MGRNVKVPMNTYIAPHFQRRRLLSTGRHYHLVPLLLLLQSEESVLGTHLEPGCPGGSFWGDSALLCFLASVGYYIPGKVTKACHLSLSWTLGCQSHLFLGTSEWIPLGLLAFLGNAGTQGGHHGPWF